MSAVGGKKPQKFRVLGVISRQNVWGCLALSGDSIVTFNHGVLGSSPSALTKH